MTEADARAFWTLAPGHGELRAERLPSPGAGEVRVRALYSGISRGSEALVFRGGVPPSQYTAMRAPFQTGDFPGPVKYGYASVGVVEAGPEALAGATVFCLHPHQDRYVVPAEAVLPLPEALPPARAVLGANMETAVNALWDAGPRVGDRIAVIGAGTVGCLVAALCARLPGARVELVDVDPARAEVAAALGVAFRAPAEAGDDVDLAVHASGSGDGLRLALALAGAEATVLELSWFGDREPALPLGEGFHSRRLTLRSSQVGRVAPARAGRRDRRERLALALGLLADPAFDALITGESPFEALPETLAALAAGPAGTLCHRVAYGAAPDR